MLTFSLLAALAIGADTAPVAPAKPTEMPLYTDRAPLAVGDGPTDKPTLTTYLPAKGKANGTAVVVCPGGGYGFLAMDHEGKQVAQWLNERGVTAFVLKYRIVGKERPAPLGEAPLLDAQRAIRTVRANAKEFGIDPKRVGIWGFSAGGHLASTATTHFDSGKEGGDKIDAISCRPDFSILAYPVISMGPVTHGGSKNNLLGAKPDDKLVEKYSNELQVTERTPPVFLFHTAEDTAVPVANSKLFEAACKKHGVPVKLVVYEKGAHGIGLANLPAQKAMPVSKWPTELEGWMNEQKLLGK